jgi:signal transduction histidine kinase/CheY-like chemotaxis protein
MASSADADVLIFAPVGRDASLTQALLTRAAIPSRVCTSVDETCAALDDGAAALILTEEVFDLHGFGALAEVLRGQPAWSDIAVLLFAGTEGAAASSRAPELLELFPNVTLIDRPVRVAVLLSIVRAALRGHARQLQVRDLVLALRDERERVEEASRLKDEFLAMLSHELRTPLNAILGWSSILLHDRVDPALHRRGLQAVERNARAQVQLVEDVLDMARIITGKLRIEPIPVEILPAVEAAVETVRPAADGKRIRLSVQPSGDVSQVLADPARLQQILWNLLSNAVKFTPEGGGVMVRIGRSHSRVEVAITDTGIGIERAFLPHVFDRFRQADQSVTRRHGGLGLGLAIVKHLAELHGGHAGASSPGPGRGATFTLTLPVAALGAGRAAGGETAETEAFALRFPGRRLLVVDDDGATRELLAELFTRAGAEVVTAASAAQAFDAVRGAAYDLIVADIGMPGEDGCALMRRIRQLPAPQGGVPALALSAYTRVEDRASTHEAGFSDFLGKPAAPQDVLRAVDRLLAESGAHPTPGP